MDDVTRAVTDDETKGSCSLPLDRFLILLLLRTLLRRRPGRSAAVTIPVVATSAAAEAGIVGTTGIGIAVWNSEVGVTGSRARARARDGPGREWVGGREGPLGVALRTQFSFSLFSVT